MPKNLLSLGQTLIPNVLLSYQLPPALAFGLIKFPLKQISYKHSRVCCTCSSLDNITLWISTESETNLICQCLCSLSPWCIAHKHPVPICFTNPHQPDSPRKQRCIISHSLCPNQMSDISPAKSVHLCGILHDLLKAIRLFPLHATKEKLISMKITQSWSNCFLWRHFSAKLSPDFFFCCC